MIGRDVLVGLHRDDVAQQALLHARAQIAHVARVAQHQADLDLRRAVLGEQLGQLEGLLGRDHDRLLDEHAHARFQAGADVLEMQMVRRGDEQELRLGREQGLDVRVGFADLDFLTQRLQPAGLRVDVAHDLQLRQGLLEKAQHHGGAMSQADDADAHG